MFLVLFFLCVLLRASAPCSFLQCVRLLEARPAGLEVVSASVGGIRVKPFFLGFNVSGIRARLTRPAPLPLSPSGGSLYLLSIAEVHDTQTADGAFGSDAVADGVGNADATHGAGTAVVEASKSLK